MTLGRFGGSEVATDADGGAIGRLGRFLEGEIVRVSMAKAIMTIQHEFIFKQQ